MKKCALIYPKNQFNIISNSVPLGSLYIASFLREHNIGVEFNDFVFSSHFEKKLQEIIDENPDVIGLTCNIANQQNVIKYSKFIKNYNKQCKIVIGGPLASAIPEYFLENAPIDAVAIGEGEETFFNYLNEGNKAKNIVHKIDSVIYKNEQKPPSIDINELPFPALDLVELKKYRYSFQKKAPISSIITSRGCPFHCKFCFHGISGYQWRPRSPKNVIKEIKWQIGTLGVNELCVWDDNFTLNMERAKDICNEIMNYDKKFSWQCSNGIRVDRIDFELLELMKKSGCWNISLAPETGDNEVLAAICKQYTLEQILQVRDWCKKLNIFTGMFFIVGLPYEKPESFAKTYAFLKKAKPDFVSLHGFVPLPGTEIVDDLNLSPEFNRGYKTGPLSPELKKNIFKLNLLFYRNPLNLLNIIRFTGLKYFLDTVFRSIKASF